MDRRTFLSRSAVAAAAPLIVAPVGAQPAQPATPPKPTRAQRLAEAMAANRMPLELDGRRFSGAGYDWLLRRGSEAQAFLLGEEHGIAENPKLAAQLFGVLVPSGYRHVAVEISPPMADAVDRALASSNPAALRTLLTTPQSRIAFFGLREEADWLRSARAALRGKAPYLWGMDYEVGADRYLIRQLASAPKPAAAKQALAKLAAASAASWAKYEQTHNPEFIYSFAGDPKLVQDLRAAWPNAGAESRLIMDTLEQTFAINRLWVEKKGYESNLVRSRFMRANLLRYWRSKPPQDRLFMKMGASHLVRGLSMTDVFDLGTLVPELAAANGGRSFHLLVLPGPGTKTANLDPTKFLYVPGNRDQYGEGMDLFDTSVIPGKFTVFDTAPLRPLASSFSGDVALPLWRVIHGFDAVLIMTGSHPSSNL
jgi:erythromycin esterase-like protein